MVKYVLDGELEFNRKELEVFVLETLVEDKELADKILTKEINKIKTPAIKARKIAARACKLARKIGYNVEVYK